MKTQTQPASAVKIKATPSAKSSARKVKSKSGRTASSLKKTAKEQQGPFAGYSKQAQEFFDRGKTAFHTASNWAGDTAKHLPGAARKLNLPDQKADMEFAEQRPLVIGAVGLGLGLVVGALLPRMHSVPAPKRSRK